MPIYCMAIGGTAVHYPFRLASLRTLYPNVSFPRDPGLPLLAEYGVFPVIEQSPPDYDVATQTVDEGTPQLVEGIWTQQWTVRDLTAEELKARVPTVVTMRQARLALLQAGLLAQVETAIAAVEDPVQRQAVQIEWEYAAEVDRNHSWVQSLATALELTEAQLDALFALAATL